MVLEVKAMKRTGGKLKKSTGSKVKLMKRTGGKPKKRPAGSHLMNPADLKKKCQEITDVFKPRHTEMGGFLPDHLQAIFGPVLPGCLDAIHAIRGEQNQIPYVQSIANALLEAGDDIKVKTTQAEEAVVKAQAKLEKQNSMQGKARSALDEAQEEVNKLRDLLAASAVSIVTAKSKIEESKNIKRETLSNYQEMSAKKRKIEKAMNGAYAPLKAGLDRDQAVGKLSELMPVLKVDVKLNKSLAAAVSAVLKTPPGDRTVSDSFVLGQLEEAVNAVGSKMGLEPSTTQLDDDVYSTQEALQEAKEKEKAQAQLLKNAQEDLKVKAKAAKEEERKTEDCAKQLANYQQAIEALKLRSAHFHEGLCYSFASIMVVGAAGNSLSN